MTTPPNYMKSTTSSDARREQANVRRNNPPDETNSSKNATKTLAKIRTLMKRTAGFKPVTAMVKEGEPESEGTSGVKVCSYSRCSLNGHVHALLPPSKSFVSARRQALKSGRSIEMRGQSRKARPTRGSRRCGKLIGRDEAATSKVFRENLEKHHEVMISADASPESSAQEANSEAMERYCIGSMDGYLVGDDYGCTPKESGEQEGKINASAEFIMKSDDRLGRFFDEISVDGVSQETFDEESLNSDTLLTETDAAPAGKKGFLFETPRSCSQKGKTSMCCDAMDGEEHNLKDESISNEDPETETGNQAPNLLVDPAEEIATSVDSATCKVITHDQDRVKNECNQVSTKDLAEEPNPAVSRSSNEGESNAVHEVNSRTMEMQETKSDHHSDEPKSFSPRELRFLPMEPDPEAEKEKVNLRHQDLDARKIAEEWMVDYALREAVTKIGSSQERKVASLVEAFERVLPTSKS